MSSITATNAYKTIQKKTSVVKHTYVMNSFLTADSSCTHRYFWEKNIKKFVAHIFPLFFWYLLHPNHSTFRSAVRLLRSLTFATSATISIFHRNGQFVDFSKTHCGSNYWLIWTQKVFFTHFHPLMWIFIQFEYKIKFGKSTLKSMEILNKHGS